MIALLREPLLHFLVLGAAIFGLFAAFEDSPSRGVGDRLEVTPSEASRMAAGFEATWRRPPTEDELSALIDAHIREEALVREARALGLDRGDAVLRERLVQKMTVLAESAAAAVEVTEDALAAHLAAHPERFARAGTVAFEQVLLRDGAEAEALRVALTTGGETAALAAPSLLPDRLAPSPRQVVDASFGRGFHDAVAALPPGDWTGPVESAFGRHLVRVIAVEPPGVPPLEEIRAAVERDWRANLRGRLAEERLRAVIDRYEVVRPDAAAILAAPDAP